MPCNSVRRYLALVPGAALLAFAGGAAADGADGPFGRPVAPGDSYELLLPPFTWTGFYVGGDVGAVWSVGNLTDDVGGARISEENSGFAGGVLAGYNYQIRNWVFGAEWDVAWTSNSHTSNPVTLLDGAVLQGFASTQWVTTLAARVGVAGDSWLAYFKAGGGWVNSQASITNLSTHTSVSLSETNGGWLVGAGIEYAFTANWTAKLEYDFFGLEDRSVVMVDNFKFDRNLQALKVGINYKF